MRLGQTEPIPTNRQLELLNREDWRFHALGPGDTGLLMIATTERRSKNSKKLVSFGLPSAPALYLNLARAAHVRRHSVQSETMFDEHPGSQGTWPENHMSLFDFLEAHAAEVIFSFTAIEAFANESIPKTFRYRTKRREGEVELEGAEIERQIPLEEKLDRVLPLAHEIRSPKGTAIWHEFTKLKRLRDRLIHLKSIDRRASGPEDQTVWGCMLEQQQANHPLTAYRMIGAFPSLIEGRRWYREAGTVIGPST